MPDSCLVYSKLGAPGLGQDEPGTVVVLKPFSFSRTKYGLLHRGRETSVE